jgi:hypothetical protein
MILLDWTRMGRSYCLAGVIIDDLDVRIVRPLLARYRDVPVRNVGWSPYLLDGHARWDVFELIAPETPQAQPPHLEDCWVRTLRPLGRSAPPELRRSILAATAGRSGETLFGIPLTTTRSSAYLLPGSGQRSLATLLVPSQALSFGVSWRDGAGGPDFRVKLPLLDLGERVLPIKDHHLLLRTQQAGTDLDAQVEVLTALVRRMGEQVAVRVGLSRAFQAEDDHGQSQCWLMADGFFSLSEPQP